MRHDQPKLVEVEATMCQEASAKACAGPSIETGTTWKQDQEKQASRRSVQESAAAVELCLDLVCCTYCSQLGFAQALHMMTVEGRA